MQFLMCGSIPISSLSCPGPLHTQVRVYRHGVLVRSMKESTAKRGAGQGVQDLDSAGG